MSLLVNVALGALAGVVGSLAGHFVLGSSYSVPVGLLTAVAGYFLGQQLQPQSRRSSYSSGGGDIEWDDDSEERKKKKAAKKKAKKEDAAVQQAREEAAKKEAKNAASKAKKANKKQVDSSEEEEEPEVVQPVRRDESDEDSDAPKSKSALKRAKQKAKELAAKKAEEEAAKKAAEQAKADKKKAKKAEKQGSSAAAPASTPAVAASASNEKQTKAQKEAAKAAAAAAAAAAADLDGWETVEPTRPTKSQQERSAAAAAKPTSNKKSAPVPASERPLVEDVIIPVKHHALIIGPKGETLQKITSGSGAEITMPKRETGSAKIEISGTEAQVYAAKNAINSLIERGFSQLTHPGILSDEVTVDQDRIGFLFGANGETLRTIQNKTNTRIKMPEKGSNSKKALIVGEKEDVRAAKAAIKSLLADGFSTLTHEGWVKQEIPFDAAKLGILMGKKGQTVKSIQGNTKTRINIPEKKDKDNKSSSSSSSSNGEIMVSVVGLPAGVAQAIKEIKRLLEPLPPLPDPEEQDLATDDAWGQEHTAQGEDALWE